MITVDTKKVEKSVYVSCHNEQTQWFAIYYGMLQCTGGFINIRVEHIKLLYLITFDLQKMTNSYSSG